MKWQQSHSPYPSELGEKKPFLHSLTRSQETPDQLAYSGLRCIQVESGDCREGRTPKEGNTCVLFSWLVLVEGRLGRPHQTPVVHSTSCQGKDFFLALLPTSQEWNHACSGPTCLRPLWVRAEHSRYLMALILEANF